MPKKVKMITGLSESTTIKTILVCNPCKTCPGRYERISCGICELKVE